MFSLVISIIAISLIVFLSLSILSISEKNYSKVENCSKNSISVKCTNTTDKNNDNSKFENIEPAFQPRVIKKEEINNYDFTSFTEILKILIGIFSFYFIFKFITKNFNFNNFMLLKKTKKIIKLSKKALSSEDNFKILTISELLEYQIQYNQEYLNFNNDKSIIELKILTKELVDIQNVIQKKYVGIAH